MQQYPEKYEERDEIGKEIFGIIKPFIIEGDRRYVNFIPSRTVHQMKNEFSDNESIMRMFENNTSDMFDGDSDQGGDNSSGNYPQGS